MFKQKTILLLSILVFLAGGFFVVSRVFGVGLGTALDMGGRNITNVSDLNATGQVKGGGGLCIGTDCKTAWPAAGVAACDTCDSRFVNQWESWASNLTVTGGATINNLGFTWGGWYESIRFNNASHAAITYPAGGLLFGLHSNRNFYWADTTNGWYSMYLEPAGNLSVRTAVYTPALILASKWRLADTGDDWLRIYNTAGSGYYGGVAATRLWGSDYVYAPGTLYTNVITDHSNSNYYMNLEGNSRLAGNLYVDGNVGIGTTGTGSYKLNVAGNSYISGTLTVDGDLIVDTPSTYSAITGLGYNAPISVPQVNTGSGGFVPILEAKTLITTGYRKHVNIGSYRTGSGWGGGIYFGQGGSDNYPTEYFLMGMDGALTHSSGKITTTGNVGIGLTSPSQKLDVSGYIKGTGLCIGSDCRTTWPAGGDITGVTAGTGISGGGTSGDVTISANTTYLQRRVSGTCSAGSSVRVINVDGTVTCETDDAGDNLGNHTATQNLNMSGYQIQNMRIENRTSDPASPAVGQIWICTDAPGGNGINYDCQ